MAVSVVESNFVIFSLTGKTANTVVTRSCTPFESKDDLAIPVFPDQQSNFWAQLI